MDLLDHGVEQADASIATVAFLVSALVVLIAGLSYIMWRLAELRRVESVK